MTKPTDHRRVWGAGFKAGQQSIIDKELANMNQAKIDKALRGQTAIATKIYQAVPKCESWTSAQIASELKRHGFSHDKKLIEGCLNSLVDSRLVAETSKGMFQAKTAADPAPVKHLQTVKDKNPPKQPPKNNNDPIDTLAALSARCAELSQAAADISSEIDAACIELLDQAKATSRKLHSMDQLQKLLKSISE